MAEGSKSKTPSSGKEKERRGRGRGRGGGGDDDGDDDRAIVDDARFAAASTRPQFSSSSRGRSADRRRPAEGDGGGGVAVGVAVDDEGKKKPSSTFDLGLGESLTRAIESDERFKSALASDPERFGFVPARDKYGRKTAKKEKGKGKKKEERLDGGDDDDERGQGDGGNRDDDIDDNDHDDGDAQDVSMEARIAYLNALSRGDISATSSSDDDEDSDDDDSDGESSSSASYSSADEVYGKSGIFDPNRRPLPGDAADDDSDGDGASSLATELSRYLCVLNLNWERVRAVDVYAMLHSFCPPGTLRGVVVYPSDFGLERMERERVEGPPAGIWKGKRGKGGRGGEGGGGDVVVDDDDDKEGDPSGHESSDDEDDPKDDERPDVDDDSDDDDDDEEEEEEEEEEGEDAFNLAEATSGLYAHFPPQSSISKNSRLRNDYEEEEGFDVERLREYEASKLRYYFAIATFASCDAASRAYEGVDGMEMEDSAGAEIDVRVLPEGAYPGTVRGRARRDGCDSLPARYEPPEDAAANALRQSRVTCTWERGDAERERVLTRYYGMEKNAWEALATGNDIGFYLATSDNSSSGGGGISSDEDDDDDDDDDAGDDDDDREAHGEGGIAEENRGEGDGDRKKKGNKNRWKTASTNEEDKKRKGSSMRAMLGLEGSDSEDEDDGGKEVEDQNSSDSCDSDSSDDKNEKGGGKDNPGKGSGERVKSPSTKSESDSSGEDDDVTDENAGSVAEDAAKDISKRQVTFMPGKRDLEGRIRCKLIQSKHVNDRDGGDDNNGLSPYEKYLEKRKEKRRERRQVVRNARRKKDQRSEDDRGHHSDGKHDGEFDHDEDDGIYGVDHEFGVAQFSDEESVGGAVGGNGDGSDGFFVDEASNGGKKTKQRTKLDENGTAEGGARGGGSDKVASTKEELELLIAGDDGEFTRAWH